jgi:hypothetical protein
MGILPQSGDDQVVMDLLGIGKVRRIADGRFMKTGLPDFRFVSAPCVDLTRAATLNELPGFLE